MDWNSVYPWSLLLPCSHHGTTLEKKIQMNVPVAAPSKTILVGQDEHGKEVYRVDLLQAHLAIESILLQRKEKEQPTEFISQWIEDFREWLSLWCGKECNTTQAWVLVQNVGSQLDKLKSKWHYRSEVAFWYNGISVENLSDEEVKLLHDQLPKLKAQKELEERKARADIDGDRVYSLLIEATGDEELADKTRANYLAAQMKAGLTPE